MYFYELKFGNDYQILSSKKRILGFFNKVEEIACGIPLSQNDWFEHVVCRICGRLDMHVIELNASMNLEHIGELLTA